MKDENLEQQLLFVWYGINTEQEQSLIKRRLTQTDKKGLSLPLLEGAILAHKRSVNIRGRQKSHILKSVESRNVRLIFRLDELLSPTLASVQTHARPTFLDRVLTRSNHFQGNISWRLVIVSLNVKLQKTTSIDFEALASNGFLWQGIRFQFLLSKEPKDGIAYFLADEAENRYPTATALREALGDFQRQPTVARAGMRLGLLVSAACGGRWHDHIKIETIDDVVGGENDDMLTDGCGFISMDLAERLPFSVTQGHVRRGSNASSSLTTTCNGNRSHTSIATAFQMRLFSPSMGVYKAVLLVNRDLPPRTIVVRPSMHKVSAAAALADKGAKELEDGATSSRGHDCLSSGEEKESVAHVIDTNKLSSVNLNLLINSKTVVVSTSMKHVDGNHRVNHPTSRQHCPLDDTVLGEDILEELSGVMREAELLHEQKQIAIAAEERRETTGMRIHDVDIEIVNTSSAPSSLCSSLNRHLILLLTSCGVPHRVFEDMLRDEVAAIASARTNHDAAIALLFEAATSSSRTTLDRTKTHGGAMSALALVLSACVGTECSETECSERVATSSSSSGSQGNGSMRALQMLAAGPFDLSEPYIQATVQQLLDRRVDALLDLRLTVSPAAYLMGVPDPTHTLAPNEIYVYHGMGWEGSRAFEGRELLVTRFPLMRTDAIKVFQSVSSSGERDKGSVLRRYFEGSDGKGSLDGHSLGGGVVVFSTQHNSDDSNGGGIGPSCPVACMGGDYDGDMYFVCGDRRIVAAVAAHKKRNLHPTNMDNHNRLSSTERAPHGCELVEEDGVEEGGCYYYPDEAADGCIFSPAHGPVTDLWVEEDVNKWGWGDDMYDLRGDVPLIDAEAVVWQCPKSFLQPPQQPPPPCPHYHHHLPSSTTAVPVNASSTSCLPSQSPGPQMPVMVHPSSSSSSSSTNQQSTLPTPTSAVPLLLRLDFSKVVASTGSPPASPASGSVGASAVAAMQSKDVSANVLSTTASIDTHVTGENNKNVIPTTTATAAAVPSHHHLSYYMDRLPLHARALLASPPHSLSPQAFQQALFWEFLDASFVLPHRNVGRLSNAWLAVADRHGPNSPLALALADGHDAALLARKYGGRHFDNVVHGTQHHLPVCHSFHPANTLDINLGEVMYPHYMQASQINHSMPGYHSSSSVGRLSDLARHLLTDIPLPSLTIPRTTANASVHHSHGPVSLIASLALDGVPLDPDMRAPRSRDFLELALRILTRFSGDATEICASIRGGIEGMSKGCVGGARVSARPGTGTGKGDDVDVAVRIADRLAKLEQHYRDMIYGPLLSELTAKLVGCSSGLSATGIADGLASALYEVCYLRAGEKLAAASRYHDAQLSRSSARNTRQQHVCGSTNVHNNTNNTDGYGICNRQFVSAVDRRRAAFAVQASSSSMRVCWALMGSTLHHIKRNNSNKKAVSAASKGSGNTPSSSGDRGRGHHTTHRDDSCKKGRVGDSPSEEWDDDDLGIAKVTAGSLLAGLCEKAFRPAISLSFRPPASK